MCEKGSWSSVPVCTSKSRRVKVPLRVNLSPSHARNCPFWLEDPGACGEPPQIPHAVVMNRAHQEVFPEDSEVRYQCKDGYVMDDGPDDQKSIFCIRGNWPEAPTCSKWNGVLFPSRKLMTDRWIRLSRSEPGAFSCTQISSFLFLIDRNRGCRQPPQVPHAVVISQGDREVFPEHSQVLYRCTDGYAMDDGPGDPKSITCINGTWTRAPTCSQLTDAPFSP